MMRVAGLEPATSAHRSHDSNVIGHATILWTRCVIGAPRSIRLSYTQQSKCNP